MIPRAIRPSFLLFTTLYTLLATSTLVSSAKSKPDEHSAANITWVEDSGICETTDGVKQMSGYINVTPNNRMWFWFFEARESPEDAPLTLWFNGGPGCAATLGLFTEVGPCYTTESGKHTKINEYSWNNVSNMLFVDQPMGTGFSQGPATVGDSKKAALHMWRFMQTFYSTKEFEKYTQNDFIIATESYGARFAPTFANFFNEQNELIDDDKLDGVKVKVDKLAINNGKHDPLIQYKSTIEFAKDAPGYGSLVSTKVLSKVEDAWEKECKPALEKCYEDEDEDDCIDAIHTCDHEVFYPTVKSRDPSALFQKSSGRDNIPSFSYLDYVRSKDVAELIGANTTYDQCNQDVKDEFGDSGEAGRSFLPVLGELADTEMPMLIWAGDADIKANWIGIHNAMVEMPWYGNKTLKHTELYNATLNGKDVGQIKSVDNFTFMRVFDAGHAMPAFQPEVALEVFSQFAKSKHGRINLKKDSDSDSSDEDDVEDANDAQDDSGDDGQQQPGAGAGTGTGTNENGNGDGQSSADAPDNSASRLAALSSLSSAGGWSGISFTLVLGVLVHGHGGIL